MHQLRLVAVSEDGSYAILAVPGRGGRFSLPIDDRLRTVARGQFARLAQYEIEVENPLRPKEIQDRIRAGETAEEIADAAGVPIERVRRFEGPVLAEREYRAQEAQRATVRSPGDSGPGPPLGATVAQRLLRLGPPRRRPPRRRARPAPPRAPAAGGGGGAHPRAAGAAHPAGLGGRVWLARAVRSAGPGRPGGPGARRRAPPGRFRPGRGRRGTGPGPRAPGPEGSGRPVPARVGAVLGRDHVRELTPARLIPASPARPTVASRHRPARADAQR